MWVALFLYTYTLVNRARFASRFAARFALAIRPIPYTLQPTWLVIWLHALITQRRIYRPPISTTTDVGLHQYMPPHAKRLFGMGGPCPLSKISGSALLRISGCPRPGKIRENKEFCEKKFPAGKNQGIWKNG